jgi:hypothetical protein
MVGTLRRWRQLVLLLAPLALAVVIYFLARAAVFPNDGTALQLSGYLVENLAVFMQGLAFPAQLVMGLVPGNALLLTWLGTGVLLAVGVALVRPRWRLFLSGLGWWALTSLPAALALLPGYVAQSERLLYVTAPGAALIYGALLERVFQRRKLTTALLVTALIGSYLWFSLEYLRLYEVLSQSYNQMRHDVTCCVPPEDDLLVINLPMQIDAQRSLLPLTRPHAFMLHDYINMDDFIWLNTGRSGETVSVVQHQPPADALEGYAMQYYGPALDSAELQARIREAGQVMAIVPAAGGITARRVGERSRLPDGEPLGTFAGTVELTAGTFVRDREPLHVSLYWNKLNDSPLPHIAFVHLVCDGQLVDQADGAPLAGFYPFDAWEPGAAWRDYRVLSVPRTVPVDCLSVRVGLYRREDGQRALLEDGSEWVTIPVR